MTALQRLVLPRVPGRMVLFIDEIDAVRSLPFGTDEFFAAIRECYNRRTQAPEFQRLSFCLLGVASPSDLVQDTRTTPFNIGKRIELNDFSPAEAAPLAAGLGRAGPAFGQAPSEHEHEHGHEQEPGPSAGRLLQRILYWTGGHPYLTQRLCQAVAGDPGVTDTGGVDRLCAELFLSAAARERDDNLLFVRERLLKSEADLASLLDLYGKVRAGKRVGADDTNLLIDLLRLSGVARLADGRLVVRNRIYAQVFDREWVVQHMPDVELRRQRAAYQRGLLRATAGGGAVAAVMAALARKARAAERNEREARQHRERLLYDADMQLAAQAWDGELGTAQAVLDLLAAHRPCPREEDLRGWEWRYQWSLLHQSALTLHAAEAPVYVALAADGPLVTVGRDRQLQRWDLASRQVIRALDLTAAPSVRQIALSQDGSTVVLGTAEGEVKLLDAATGQERWGQQAAGRPITMVRFLPGDQRLMVMLGHGGVRVWDAGTGQEEEVLHSAHPSLNEEFDHVMAGRIPATVLSPDGRTMVLCGGHRVSVLDWRESESTDAEDPATRLGHSGSAVTAVAFSPDGRLLATCQWAGHLSFWDSETRRQIGGGLENGSNVVTRLAFSPNGRTLAAGSQDGIVRLWDVPERRERRRLKGHTAPISQLIFSTDGQRLVTGSEDGDLKVWDRMDQDASGAERLRELPGQARTVAYSPDGKRLAVGGGGARLWDTASGQWVRTLREERTTGDGADDHIYCVAFSPDGYRLATGNYGDSRVVLWDAATGRMTRLLHERGSDAGPREGIGSLAFSPDSTILAAGFGQRELRTRNHDQVVRLWEVESGREIRTLQGHQNFVPFVAFSPDGQVLASASDDHTVRLWRVKTGQPIRLFTGPGLFRSVAFSPDGRYLAAGSENGDIWLWEAATGREENTLRGHTGGVWSLAFSPDGRTLASGSVDRTVKLWDFRTGRELRTLAGYAYGVISVAFSPDGRTLAAAGWSENGVRLWEAASWSEIAAWEAEEAPAEARRAAAARERALRAALHLEASSDGLTVRLRWQPLPGAEGYRVYRGPGKVEDPSQLTELNLRPIAGTTFLDRGPGLVSGGFLTYAVSPLFPGATGRPVEGPRVTVRARPVAPPAPVGSSPPDRLAGSRNRVLVDTDFHRGPGTPGAGGGWTMNGHARLLTIDGRQMLSLTQNQLRQAGVAWHERPSQLPSFRFLADLRIRFDPSVAGRCPADGAALVFARAAADAIGNDGGALGLLEGPIDTFTSFEISTYYGHGLVVDLEAEDCRSGKHETFAFDWVDPSMGPARRDEYRGLLGTPEEGGTKIGQTLPPQGMRIVNGGWYRYEWDVDGPAKRMTVYVSGLEASNRRFQHVKVLEVRFPRSPIDFEGRFGLAAATGGLAEHVEVAAVRIEAPP